MHQKIQNFAELVFIYVSLFQMTPPSRFLFSIRLFLYLLQISPAATPKIVKNTFCMILIHVSHFVFLSIVASKACAMAATSGPCNFDSDSACSASFLSFSNNSALILYSTSISDIIRLDSCKFLANNSILFSTVFFCLECRSISGPIMVAIPASPAANPILVRDLTISSRSSPRTLLKKLITFLSN